MIRAHRIRLVVLIILVQMLCSFAAERPSSAPPPEQPPVKSMMQLKTQVDKLLAAGDPVMIRKGIGDVLTLVDRLIRSGQQKEAFNYLSAALRYHPWALDHQLLFAEMLAAQGMTDLARERAELVLQYAERDQQVNRARKLLQKSPLPAIPAAVRIPGDTTTLVLVPIGKVDTCILEELRDILRTRLGIPVFMQDVRVRVPRFRKDPLEEYIAGMRRALYKRMKEEERVGELLQSKGIRLEDLEQDSELVKAYRDLIFGSGNTELLARLDADLERLRQADKQWHINSLLANLRAAASPFRQNRVYFLGIVNLDACDDHSDFTFGAAEAGGHHAVLTYRRFTAAFNGDSPNRKRLLERMFKQSLSLIGYMFGIGRCSSPTCPRAYSPNLPEEDAKSTELCHACQAAFERVYGVRLQKKTEDPRADGTSP